MHPRDVEDLVRETGPAVLLAELAATCDSARGRIAGQRTDLLAQGSAGFLCASIILLVRMGSVWFGWRTRQLTKEPSAVSGGPTA